MNRESRRAMRAKTRHAPGKVQCGEHGLAAAYAVCVHVKDEGSPVRAVSHPAPKDPIGSIVCGEMHPDEHEVDELALVCAGCARARGWLRS